MASSYIGLFDSIQIHSICIGEFKPGRVKNTTLIHVSILATIKTKVIWLMAFIFKNYFILFLPRFICILFEMHFTSFKQSFINFYFKRSWIPSIKVRRLLLCILLYPEQNLYTLFSKKQSSWSGLGVCFFKYSSWHLISLIVIFCKSCHLKLQFLSYRY